MPNVRGLNLLREIAAAPVQPGVSAARARFREEAFDMVEREELLDAAFSYRIVDLELPAGEVLNAGGEALYAPRLLPESGELTALACCVATIGPSLERRVTSLFAERRASLALALDELGNRLLFQLSRRAQDRIHAVARKSGVTISGELRAGDPGLPLEAQAATLRLADADSIGLSLSSGYALNPLKSTSMILGVGIDLPPASWSRCDDCPSRPRCKLAAAAAEAAAA